MYKKFERFLAAVLKQKKKKTMILWGTLVAFLLSVMMFPTEIVLAKMLPGKNSDTFNIYVDLREGSSIQQTQQVSECVVSQLQKEKEIVDIELFLGTGSPLDFAGLIKGSHFKNSENVAEIVDLRANAIGQSGVRSGHLGPAAGARCI